MDTTTILILYFSFWSLHKGKKARQRKGKNIILDPGTLAVVSLGPKGKYT
jgi:hypothetical protein